MKRVLVTGGAGFIGSHVVDLLLEKNYDVHVVDNLKNGTLKNLTKLPNERFHKIDLGTRIEIKKLLQKIKPEAVYHLAAIHFIPYCNQHPLEALQTNVMGTRILLEELAATHLPAKIFFASTAAVYPPSDQPHLESDLADPMDIYGISKIAGETLLQHFQLQHNLALVIGRLFNAVGKRETNPHLLPDIVNQLKAGSRSIELGNLTPKRDFVDARDMCKAIVLSLEQQPSGYNIFNIGAGQEYSVFEVVQICEKILGEKIQIIESDKLKRKVERQHLKAGVEKIRKAIGWQPTITLEQTLRDLLFQ
jgi:UDP-glucose 4-epimerase